MSKHTPRFTAPVAGHWLTDEGTDMANRYADMKREDLAFGHKSDLEMANAIYMADRHSLDLIMLQTAAKDRIRWLSAQLAVALSSRVDVTDAMVEAGLAEYSEGGCMGLDERERREVVIAILTTALSEGK